MKNKLKNRMMQSRLNNLNLTCIKNDILESVDFNDTINDL